MNTTITTQALPTASVARAIAAQRAYDAAHPLHLLIPPATTTAPGSARRAETSIARAIAAQRAYDAAHPLNLLMAPDAA